MTGAPDDARPLEMHAGGLCRRATRFPTTDAAKRHRWVRRSSQDFQSRWRARSPGTTAPTGLYEKRLKGYRAIGYELEGEPDNDADV